MREELFHVAKPRARHRVTAIHECMNRNSRNSLLNREIDQCKEMLIDRVHSACANQSHQVKRATGFLYVLTRGK